MDFQQLNRPTHDISKIINHNHLHSYMFSVLRDDLSVEDMKTAESYAVIAQRFEFAIAQIKSLVEKRQIERCPSCGRARRHSSFIQVRYWVMTRDDVLF